MMEQHEDMAGKSIISSADSVLVDHLFSVAKRMQNIVHESLAEEYMSTIVIMSHNVMDRVHTATYMIVQHQVETITIWCKAKVKVGERIMPRASVGQLLKCNLYRSTTHEQ